MKKIKDAIKPTRRSSKTVITKDEKLKVLGLLTLAQEHNKALHQIEVLLNEILGEKEKYGHCGDTVWGNIADNSPQEECKRLIDVLDLKVK